MPTDTHSKPNAPRSNVRSGRWRRGRPACLRRTDDMSLILFWTDRFSDHLTPPGHPERVERAEVMRAVISEWQQRGGVVREPRPATRTELLRVHNEHHLATIDATAGRA